MHCSRQAIHNDVTAVSPLVGLLFAPRNLSIRTSSEQRFLAL